MSARRIDRDVPGQRQRVSSAPPISAQRVRALEEAGGGFDRATWQQIAELGWLSILVPEDDGGLGLGIAEVAAPSPSRSAASCCPNPLSMQACTRSRCWSRLPSAACATNCWSKIQAGETVAGVAWQESAGELEAGSVPVRTSPRGDVSQSGRTASASCAPAPAPTAGSSRRALGRRPRTGMGRGGDCGRQGRLRIRRRWQCHSNFDLRRGGRKAPLTRDEIAQTALQAANELARIAQGAELAGIARRALELTREYLSTRVQFGKPIGSFQALQHRLVDGLIQVELAEACLREAAGLADRLHACRRREPRQGALRACGHRR